MQIMNKTRSLKRIGCDTYAVPKNKLGVFAIHMRGSPAPNRQFVESMIDGPLAAMESKLDEELRKLAQAAQYLASGLTVELVRSRGSRLFFESTPEIMPTVVGEHCIIAIVSESRHMEVRVITCKADYAALVAQSQQVGSAFRIDSLYSLAWTFIPELAEHTL